MALFHCETCNTKRPVPDKFSGRKARCPSCRNVVTILPEETPLSPPSVEDIVDALPESPLPPRSKRSASFHSSMDSSAAISLAKHQKKATVRHVSHGGLTHNAAAALGAGVLMILFCLAYAQAIQAAVPQSHLMTVVFGMGIVATAVFSILLSLVCSLPVLAAGPETASFCLMFLLASHIGQSEAIASPQEAQATVIAGLMGTAFLTAICCHLFYRAKAGRVLRFVPQPVVGGLMAGIGLTTIQAMLFTTGGITGIHDILNIASLQQTAGWLPPVALGLLMMPVLLRTGSLVPATIMLFAGAGAAYAAASYYGLDMATATRNGWLLSNIADSHTWQGLYRSSLIWVSYLPDAFSNTAMHVNWHVLANNAEYMFAAVILIVIALSDKVNVFELALEEEVELDTIVRGISAASFVSALAGGLTGSLGINRFIGATSFKNLGAVSGIFTGVVVLSSLVWLPYALPYIPTFIPSALFVCLGLCMMYRWIISTRREFTRSDDYILLLTVFFVCAFMGILAGMTAAFFLSILLMAWRYGKINVIKHMLPGSHHRSRVDRSSEELGILKQRGDQILMMRLQGFIFLGTTSRLIQSINERLEQDGDIPLKYLIMDFTLVSGLDAQVAISFTKLKQLASHNQFTLIFTNIPFEVEQQLEKGGYSLNDPSGITLSFIDMDYALEWCEDRILLEEGIDLDAERSFATLLKPVFPEPEKIDNLTGYLDKLVYRSGEVIFRQGDASDAMFFIEKGMVTIQLELGGRKTIRLKKMGPGTVFGEMGIYTQAPRSASAIASENCTLYRLSQAKLDIMQSKDPYLLSAIHRFVVYLLSQRVSDANDRVRDLLR